MSDPQPPRSPRRYSDDETREILKRAIERQHAENDQTAHDDLLAAAREVGIDPDHFDRAANEVVAERDRASSSSVSITPSAHGDDVVEVYRRESKQSLLYRFAITVVLVGGLAAVDYLTGGGWWVQWVALVGVVLLAIRGARLLRPAADIRRDLEKQDRRARRRKERAEQHAQRRHERRKKAERHAAERDARRQRRHEHADARGEPRGRSHGREFERTVEEGVKSLLAEHTRRMQRMTKRAVEERANEPLVRQVDRANAAVADAATELNERIARAVSGQPNDAPRVRVGGAPVEPDAERSDAGEEQPAEADAEIDTRRERPRSK